MPTILSYGSYVPWRALSRAAVVEANRWLNPALAGNAAGTRAMAAWDEDSITMAVEAGRAAIAGRSRSDVSALAFASTTFPFADRQNGAVIATALQLPERLSAMDVGGSQRAGTTALLNALRGMDQGRQALVAASDKRKAQAASTQELHFGDAAAAFLVGEGQGIADVLGGSSVTVDFVDHYRGAGHDHDYQWEERWVRDEGLKKIVPAAAAKLLEELNVAPGAIDHFICPTSLRRADSEVAAKIGIAPAAVRPDLAAGVGHSGVAHPLLMLADLLDTAGPDETILVVGFGQGCDLLLFRTTAALPAGRSRAPLDAQLQRRKHEENYLRYLVFNDLIDWEKGKRAERDRQTALTTLYRRRDMITALVGGECQRCGTRQFPRVRICVNPNCRGVDTQEPYSFAEEPATIASWSGDNLVFTYDPPLYYGFATFAGGGKFLVEFADCEAADIRDGAPVRMMFRIKDVDAVRGFRRYFWKAVPDRRSSPPAGDA